MLESTGELEQCSKFLYLYAPLETGQGLEQNHPTKSNSTVAECAAQRSENAFATAKNFLWRKKRTPDVSLPL